MSFVNICEKIDNIMTALHCIFPLFHKYSQDTPYLTLTGELWDVFYKYLLENWQYYDGTALYFSPFPGYPPLPGTVTLSSLSAEDSDAVTFSCAFQVSDLETAQYKVNWFVGINPNPIYSSMMGYGDAEEGLVTSLAGPDVSAEWEIQKGVSYFGS